MSDEQRNFLRPNDMAMIAGIGRKKNDDLSDDDDDDNDSANKQNISYELDEKDSTKKIPEKEKDLDDILDEELDDDEDKDYSDSEDEDSDNEDEIEDEENDEDKEKYLSEIKNTEDEYINSDDDDDEDDEEEEDEDYFKKFDENVKKNVIQDYHPEIIQHNYEEIEALAKVVRNDKGVIIDPLHKTLPFITKYEKARILGDRARQINAGSKPFVKVEPFIIDGYLIALKEFEEKKIPFIIKRPLPNGGTEYWRLKDLEILL